MNILNLKRFFLLSRVRFGFLLFHFFFLFFLPAALFSETIKINSVRYFLPDGSGLSVVSDITIEGDKITEIQPAQNSKNIRYVTPAFCDSFATLGSDPLGGIYGRTEIELALKSFLAHGFTDIQSVGDGDWVRKFKSPESAPDLYLAGKPLIPVSDETDKLNKTVYLPLGKSMLTSNLDTLIPENNVYIFHRIGSKTQLDASDLFQLKDWAFTKKKRLIASTFADRFSIIESLSAGIRYIHHPIPDDYKKNLYSIYMSELHWSPMFNVYYFQSRSVEDLNKETGFMVNSLFFKTHYKDRMSLLQESLVLDTKTLEEAKNEYDSYIYFLKDHLKLAGKMILSGGSGYKFAFAGISGINEMKILHEAGIPLTEIIRISSSNTCEFIGAPERSIRKAGNAYMNIYSKNPLESPQNLLSLEMVIKKGKIVYTEQNEPEVRKKEDEHGRKTKRKK